MKILVLILFSIFFLSTSKLYAKKDILIPSSLIFFDYPGTTVIVVDKSICRLMVYGFQEEF